MINNRLTKWSEEGAGRRAVGQGGFRKGRRTTDHILLLQHMIEHSRLKRRKPLFACFIDLSKAFDTINRDKLWHRLHGLGVRGTMLSALKAYYSDVRECVKTGDGLSDTIQSQLGVKQGCPLSPTLFGLYIDALEPHARRAVLTPGIKIGGHSLPIMLYADDIVLLASSESSLQSMLNALDSFCSENELTVNLSKSAVVVFESNRLATPCVVMYRGQAMPVADSYCYLGVMFGKRNAAAAAMGPLLEAGRKALCALERMAFMQHITDIGTLCRMFDTLVVPIITYGAEVWGATLSPFELGNPLERMHLGFLKRITGMRVSTDSNVVLLELGRKPLTERVWWKVGTFWGRLQQLRRQRGPTEPMHHILSDNACLAQCRQGQGWRSCWSLRAFRGLHAIGFQGEESSMMDLDVENGASDVAGLFEVRRLNFHRKQREDCMKDNRDLYTSASYEHKKGERMRTYLWLFYDSDWSLCTTTTSWQGRKDMKQLTRFRTGSHDLSIVRGAWSGTARDRRICRCCPMNVVEDETHFILECTAYSHVRSSTLRGGHFRQLFEALGDNCCPVIDVDGVETITIILDDTVALMRKLFAQRKQLLLARYISECYRVRDAILHGQGATGAGVSE